MNASWLRAMQSPDGGWTDFWIPSGIGTEWVTAYAGASLATLAHISCRDAARAAWRSLVAAQHEDGGWGYGPAVPSDGDSTAWALILAQRIGEARSAAARRAFRFLRSLRRSGGVATYGDAAAIRDYVGASESTDFSGWLQPHACVTAVAAQVDGFDAELRDDILAAQRSDGPWIGYWWFEPAYATAMSVIALTPWRTKRERASVEAALSWARRYFLEDGEPSSFALALLLTIFARAAPDEADALLCAETLRRRRARDGSWRGSARLRVPAPHHRDPGCVEVWNRWWGRGSPFNVFSIDQSSVFTTATAHYALGS